MGIEVTLDDIAPPSHVPPKSVSPPRAVAAVSNIEVLLDENDLVGSAKNEESDTEDETDDDDDEHTSDADVALHSGVNESNDSDSCSFKGMQERAVTESPQKKEEQPQLEPRQAEPKMKKQTVDHPTPLETKSQASEIQGHSTNNVPAGNLDRAINASDYREVNLEIVSKKITKALDESESTAAIHKANAAQLVQQQRIEKQRQQVKDWLCLTQEHSLDEEDSIEDDSDDTSTENSITARRRSEGRNSDDQEDENWLCYTFEQQPRRQHGPGESANPNPSHRARNGPNLRYAHEELQQQLQQPDHQPQPRQLRTQYRQRWVPASHGGQWVRARPDNQHLFSEDHSERRRHRCAKSSSAEDETCCEEGREEEGSTNRLENRPNQDDTAGMERDESSPTRPKASQADSSEEAAIEAPPGMDGVMTFLKAIQLSEDQYPLTMGNVEEGGGGNRTKQAASGKGEDIKITLKSIEEAEEKEPGASSKVMSKLTNSEDQGRKKHGSVDPHHKEAVLASSTTDTPAEPVSTRQALRGVVGGAMRHKRVCNSASSKKAVRSAGLPPKGISWTRNSNHIGLVNASASKNAAHELGAPVVAVTSNASLPALMDDVSALQDDDSIALILDNDHDFGGGSNSNIDNVKNNDVITKITCDVPTALYSTFACHGADPY